MRPNSLNIAVGEVLDPDRPSLNPALYDFWSAPARNRILYGGRASSKSWDAAGNAIAIAQACKVKFMCARQFQNKIEESVYSLLKIQIKRFGLWDDFIITNNKIKHRHTGSEFIFYGIARNLEDIKSTEDVDILWIEEGHFLTAEQWEDLEPTIRKEGSEVWIIFNPKYITDFVWKRFVVKPPPDTITRQINFNENPFLSNTMRKVIEAKRLEDEDDFNHIYLGQPRTDEEASVIKRSHILAAIDAHIKLGIKPSGSKRLGYDVADGDGELTKHDTNAIVATYGFLAVYADQWTGKQDDLLGSCSKVYAYARSIQAHIYYDNVGIGAFSGSKFKELNQVQRGRIRYTGFGAGEKIIDPDVEYEPGVTNRDFFSNLKAQTWWTVADLFRNTYNAVVHGQKFRDDEMISISGNIKYLEQLIDELSTPRKDFDAAGRVKVEGKKDLAKRNIASHNIADAFVMNYSPLVRKTINYKDLM